MLAEDRFPDRKIAELCGISEQSLNKWKQRPEFSARVQELRGLEEQIARELGQWKEKSEVDVHADGVAERVEAGRKRVLEHNLEWARKVIAEHEGGNGETQAGEQ